MVALLHIAQRLDAVVDRPGADRKRLELAVVHSADHVAQHRPQQTEPFPDQPVEVDGKESQVLPKRLQAKPSVLVDVALANFEEAAVVGQNRYPARDGRARQRVEDQVHAAPEGASHDNLGEVERTRVGNALDSQRLQILALLGRAGGRKDLGASVPCQLNRRQANAAGCRMDQHSLAAGEAALILECVTCSEEGDRQSRRLKEAEACRLDRHQLGPGHDMTAKGKTGDRQDQVANSQLGHALADSRDPAAALCPQGHRPLG